MARFPKALAALVPDDLSGTVEGLTVRPRRKAPVQPVDAWDLSGSADHGRSSKRAVTLIAAEDVGAIAATLGRPVDWTATRRNVLVRGINLGVLRGRRFRIGEVVLEGTKPCDPCSRMPGALDHPAAYAAMVGRGGLCAAVVEPGTIRVGDRLTLLPLDDEAD